MDQDALLHYAKPINAAEPNPAGPPRSVAVQLLRQMMWEPFFDQLRTKEQLGYNVSTDVKVTAEVSGLVFALQAANHAPDYLEARVEAFLIRFREMLAKMSSGQYQNHVRGVLMGKLRPFTNLSEVRLHFACPSTHSSLLMIALRFVPVFVSTRTPLGARSQPDPTFLTGLNVRRWTFCASRTILSCTSSIYTFFRLNSATTVVKKNVS